MTWGSVTHCKGCGAPVQWHKGRWSEVGQWFDCDGGKHTYTCVGDVIETAAAIDRIWAWEGEAIVRQPPPPQPGLKDRVIPAEPVLVPVRGAIDL